MIPSSNATPVSSDSPAMGLSSAKRFLDIREIRSGQIVTTIEVLSPANTLHYALLLSPKLKNREDAESMWELLRSAGCVT